jgi:hypothetical protein
LTKNGTNTRCSADFLRIPQNRWLPSPSTFINPVDLPDGVITASNGFAGDDGYGAGGAGKQLFGTGVIENEKIVIESGDFLGAEDSTSDIWAYTSLTLPNEAVQGGLCLRLDDENNPQNFILVYIDRSTSRLKVESVVAGVYSNILNEVFTYSENAELSTKVSGTSLDVFYNNAKIGTTVTVPASTAIKHALFGTDTSIQYDKFETRPVGTEGQYSILERYMR